MTKKRDPHEDARKAAERLHHLSMRYAGALVELVAGQAVGLLAKNHPGLSECRDLIDLILLTRAETNALTAILLEKKVVSAERFAEQMADEYNWLAGAKAQYLGVGLFDGGITFHVGPKPEGN